MEDNDLRGFLDGKFIWGWNQPGQSHVRFGRRASSPRYGEHELFRVVQRWEGVRLPPSARVSRADLVLHVEEGPEHPVRVLLYRVNRDWSPGAGGIQMDNVSPPAPGEVWWNGSRFGEEQWGLPGAGHAGRGPGSDTPETALADAVYRPGDSLLVFSDPGLASYVEEHATAGEPLRFLLKTSDVQEDRPGSLVAVYSANDGDTRNASRKPRLEVRWSGAAGRTLHRERVILEYGRSTDVGPFAVPPRGWIDVSFAASDGYAEPLVEVRGGETPDDTTGWTPVAGPMPNRWSWLQARLRALHDPVEIGSPFEFEIHETWVLRDPSTATVEVAFAAPSGRRHVVEATYRGGYRWRVSFVPNEVGRWRYRWIADFAESPTVSAVGRFDVVGGSRERLRNALGDLVEDLENLEDARSGGDTPADTSYLYGRFLRIEREVMRLESPRSFRSDTNSVLPLLDRAREALYGARLPDSIPLVVSPSHRDRDESARD